MTELEMSAEFGELSSELRFIINLAQRAGKLILGHQPSQTEFARKGPDEWGDFVSAADLASEALILGELRTRFPEDGILSEEEGATVDYAKAVWFVDPLDGTKMFKFGGVKYGVMIGRYRNGKPDLGVGYAPAIDQLYMAERGKGAWRKLGEQPLERLQVSAITDLSQARFIVRTPVVAGDVRPIQDAFDVALPIKERIQGGSIFLKFGMIAAREAEASINTNRKGSKWDTCAAQVILEEAGGMVTDLDGKPLDYTQSSASWGRSYVASNGVLHPQVLELCKALEF